MCCENPFLSSRQVREFFKACGTMVTVDMPLRDGRASGTAYITFDSDEGVDKALELNEATFGDSGRWVRVLKYTAQQATARKSFGGETKEKPEGCTSVFIGASTFFFSVFRDGTVMVSMLQ